MKRYEIVNRGEIGSVRVSAGSALGITTPVKRKNCLEAIVASLDAIDFVRLFSACRSGYVVSLGIQKTIIEGIVRCL